MQVLIVDDDAVIRQILTRQLQRLGHQVEVTSTAEEAWDALAGLHYPLVVSDWMMPGMTGLDLCRKVRDRETDRYTYVILLTALSGKERYLEAMGAGVDDFLSKPPDIDQLGARIHVAERILGLQKQLKSLEELLPICSYCKNIKDEQEHWSPIETYLSKQTETRLTHGICPDCYAKHFGHL